MINKQTGNTLPHRQVLEYIITAIKIDLNLCNVIYYNIDVFRYTFFVKNERNHPHSHQHTYSHHLLVPVPSIDDSIMQQAAFEKSGDTLAKSGT